VRLRWHCTSMYRTSQHIDNLKAKLAACQVSKDTLLSNESSRADQSYGNLYLLQISLRRPIAASFAQQGCIRTITVGDLQVTRNMDSEGTQVAKGNHVVPKGVAVEELDGGKKKLSKTCPEDVKTLLESKNLMPVYDKMVAAVVETSATRNLFGFWKDAEFVSIIDLFRDDFADAGVKVALCRRKSGSGTFRWLEFIDTEVVPDYVPQYDVANLSGQVIKTVYTTLEFPYGVAAEELKQWGGRKKLRDKIPIYVEKMMTEKGTMEEYEMLVQACVNEGVGARMKNWKLSKLNEVMAEYKPKFEAKGIAVFVCHKQEYVSHGPYGGHNEHFRWIEFVDRELQPNYFPQRDAVNKEEKDCTIM